MALGHEFDDGELSALGARHPDSIGKATGTSTRTESLSSESMSPSLSELVMSPLSCSAEEADIGERGNWNIAIGPRAFR